MLISKSKNSEFRIPNSEFGTRYTFFLAVFFFMSCENTDDHQYRTWQSYGSGPDQSKYFIQDQITKENVTQLEVAWTYPTSDERDYQCNPVIVDTVMYVLAKDNSLVALNATTGKEIWIHANLQGISRRGFAYWENADRTDR